MKLDALKRATAGSIVLLALASCAGGTPEVPLSLRTPDVFTGSVSGNTLSGSYNPNKFTIEEVQSLVAATCTDAQLGEFTTQTGDGVLVEFAATCEAWAENARLVEYLRSAGSNFIIKIFGRAVKDLSFTQRELSL